MVAKTIKQGYQHTVGIIPDDWAVIKIKNIAKVIRGASPRPKGDKRFYGGDVPRLMVEDVTRDGKFVTPVVDFLTKEGEKRSRPCKKGTLTIVCSGTVGIPSFLAKDACIHDGFLALVNIKKNISEDYLYHQLSNLRKKFESGATHGGVFTNLTTTIMKEFFVPFPPTKEEQISIAQILSDTAELIKQLDYLISKKRNIKQGGMQELLTGKRRLEGFSENWDTKHLGEIIEISKGEQLNKSNLTLKGDYPVWNGGIQPSGFTNTYNQMENTITISEGGNSCGFVNYSLEKFWSGGHCYVLNKPKLELSKIFLYQTLKNSEKSIMKLRVGSGLPNIQKKRIIKFPVLLPSDKQEQIAIAEILADMDDEIERLKKKRAKYLMLKNGMIQKLLTGEIRLK